MTDAMYKMKDALYKMKNGGSILGYLDHIGFTKDYRKRLQITAEKTATTTQITTPIPATTTPASTPKHA